MDPKVLRDLLQRIRRLETRSARVRYGIVSATGPLAVKLGNADTAYTDVRQLATPSALVVNDHVAVLVRGNDLLVLGKVV